LVHLRKKRIAQKEKKVLIGKNRAYNGGGESHKGRGFAT